MPQALIPFFTAIGFSAGTAAFLSAITFNVLLSKISDKLFGPKTPEGVGLSGIQVTTRGALEYRKFIYGQAMVSGPIVYQNTSGVDNEDLWFVIPLAGHKSDSFISIWLDGDEIPVADIDWTPGTGASDGTGTGAVTTTKFVGDNNTTAVFIYYYLGDTAQPVCGPLNTAFTDITTAFRGRGVTYMVVRLRYVPDTVKVWENGIPNNLKALIKGKPVYDSRLDSTNGGTGAHRYTDSTTWAWSENPSVCTADYMVNYLGVAAASGMTWATWAAAADDCDVTVAIPTASTETRFTCNGVGSEGSGHKDNIDSLISSMDGRVAYSSGVWRGRASVWETPDFTIVENDLSGDISVRGSGARSDRFNLVKGVFIDPARDYQPVEFNPATAAEFVTRDNGDELPFDLQLPFTNSEYMAQRIAFRLLEQGDNQVVAEIPLTYIGSDIAIGDLGQVTVAELSWSAKTVRCIAWKKQTDGSVVVTVREDQAASYTDPLESEYTTTTGGVITAPSTVVAPPTALTATSVFEGVRLNWTNPARRLFEEIEIWASDDNVRANASIIATAKGNVFFDTMSDIERTRYYWIRAVNFEGIASNYEPNTSTTTASAFPRRQEGPLVADPFIRLGASFWDVGGGSQTSYQTSGGLNGTAAIRMDSVTPLGALFYAAARRGPREWDVQAFTGLTIQVRWRSKLVSTAGSWTQSILAVVKVSDNDELNPSTYIGDASDVFVYTEMSTIGVWHDESATVVITDTGTPPRFMQIGLQVAKNFGGPEWDIDFLDAVIQPNIFSGKNSSGSVPVPTVESGKVLQDDGTWIANGDRPQTQGEIDASVVPTDTSYSPGDVRRYGAAGTGVTDDTAALQAAIDVCEQDKTPVFLPAGTYLVSSALDLPSQTTIIGVGELKSRILCNSATANVLTSTSTTLLTLERFQISFNVTRTAGAAMDFTSSTHGTCRDVRILAPFNAVNFMTCTNWKFENVLNTTGVGDNNRGWYIRDSISMEFRNCTNQWGTQFPTDAGFIVESDCDTVIFHACQSVGGTSGNSKGWDIRNSFTGKPPRWIKLFGCSAEGGLSTDIAQAEIGYLISDCTSVDIIGCYVTSSRDGLRITGGRGVRVIGGEYFQNGRHGISISGGSGHRVIGADIHNNSQETATTYDGINIGGAVTDFQLCTNNVGTATNYGAISAHRYDINVTANAADDYVITSNILKDGNTAPLLDAGTGTNKVVRDNVIGSTIYQTFASGDTTPNISGGEKFFSNATAVTISRLDGGATGQEISIISKGATVYDTSPATGLIGSTVDITTASGDITTWICEIGGTVGSVWRLKGFVDVSVDNSAGA